MLYKMKLNESPFERIKNGTKTIEFRLYDEKRQQVKVGDQIEFSKLPNLQEKLKVDVIGLYREETFEKLFKKLYSDDEEKVETRNWDEDGNIQMLDLEIIPNMPELTQEKKKIEEFLRKTQEAIKMQGREKEIGLDELRKQIRTENNENYDR